MGMQISLTGSLVSDQGVSIMAGSNNDMTANIISQNTKILFCDDIFFHKLSNNISIDFMLRKQGDAIQTATTVCVHF